jgi:acetyl esterase/lipase
MKYSGRTQARPPEKSMKAVPILILFAVVATTAFSETDKAVRAIINNFDRIDANGDGALSREEFASVKAVNRNVAEAETAVFAGDRNNDGVITRDELRSIAVSGKAQSTARKAASALKALGLTGEQDVVYRGSPENGTMLDIIFPGKKVYERAPLFIYIHGGGYTGGSRAGIYNKTALIKTLTDAGVAVASIDYRLASPDNGIHMNHINQDCKDALRYLAQHAGRFGIDPDKFITWGTSAGGSLALITAMTRPGFLPGEVTGENIGHTVIGSVVYFGAASFFTETGVWKDRKSPSKPYLWEANSGLSPEEIQRLTSPDRHLTNGCPPLLLFYGDRDYTVPVENGRYLNALAASNGVEVSYYEIKNTGHGFKAAAGKPSMTRPEIDEVMAEYVLKWVSR